MEEINDRDDPDEPVRLRARWPTLVVGKIPFASSRHEVTERLLLADSRKIRPSNMFMQPRTNRKKAETSVKSSTCWDRTAAPILPTIRRVDQTAKKKTHSPWKIPSAPSPKLEPSTGKNRSKKADGQPTSERKRIITWKMMRRRLMTAQKTPPIWLGTVLFLLLMSVNHHT